MDEVADVAVGIADEPIHGLRRQAPPTDRDVGPFEEAGRQRHRGVVVEAPRVERHRDERSVDAEPAGRGMQPVEVARRSREALAAVFLLDRALRQVDVRLAGRGAANPLRPYGRFGHRRAPAVTQAWYEVSS